MLLAGGLIGSLQIELALSSVSILARALPGFTISTADLSGTGASAIGLVLWFVGLDELLISLGLWTKHRLARWIAAAVSVLSAYWCVTSFLLQGVLGSPGSLVGLLANACVIYVLLKSEVWVPKDRAKPTI
jgi:hypothetical protein